ncbi:MAG: thiamine-phosphate kinase [Nitrospirae bacterium RBG_19FT_COMBO_55_12]|nr:MAG: thiamine-phosphate kinase [Nitrospirae bacterium RBG_19FT_COMBO_55_12]
MKISALGEFGLIRHIQKLFSRKAASTLIGIGDDAAALRLSPASVLLATTDMLLEDVHFDLSFTDFYTLGWKSAAVNLSDIAAMGGIPRFCLVSLGIPPAIAVERITEFYKGFHALTRAHKASLVGGDTCLSRKGLVISITVLGEIEKAAVITRSGARPGDRVFVTGPLGDSAAGLEILKTGGKGQGAGVRGQGAGRGRAENKLIQKHLRPVPRIAEGRKLALSGCVNAMIDISDGLSSDLAHICEQSRVGAEIYADTIPFSRDILREAGKLKKPPLEYALSGGEDYEILFTASPAKINKLRSLRLSIIEIGKIIRGKDISLIDRAGKRTPLRPRGYDHFRPIKGRAKRGI